MKILYSHYLANEDHPAVKMVHAIAAELHILGHDVHIHRSFGLESSQSGDASKMAARSDISSTIRNKLWFAKALGRNRLMGIGDLRVLDRFQPDIVLARQDSYCCSMAVSAAKRNVPLVTYADAPVAYETRQHDKSMRWHPPGLVEAVEKWNLRQSAAVITVSHPAASELKRYQLNLPIRVISNGVHPERYLERNETDRQSRLKSLGIEGKTILGFQGGFQPFHGLALLKELMLATAHRSDVHWLLIGDGPGRATLEKEVTGKVSVTFLGRQPSEAMGELLSLIDIAIAPHQFQGVFYFCPLKILECAAAGCAIIASDQGDIAKLLDEGRAGVLIQEDSLASWTSAMNRLVDQPEQRRTLGKAARAWVIDHLTWKQTAEGVENVLQEALGIKQARQNTNSLARACISGVTAGSDSNSQ